MKNNPSRISCSKIIILFVLGIFLFVSFYGCDGTEIPKNDSLYAKYREGVVKRHIASNGRYLEYIWLRSKDEVDYGRLYWPDAKLVPSVNPNERMSSPDEGYIGHYWVPVIYNEMLSRSVPTGYLEQSVLGYIAIEPGNERIPLYEWKHNTEDELSNSDFIDHYYSIDPDSLVARHRYRQTGIVGYVAKNATPGYSALYVGFHPDEKNHILTTNKANPQNLLHFRLLGHIKNSYQISSEYKAAFKEYRKESTNPLDNTDNFYSAVTTSKILPDTSDIEFPRIDRDDPSRFMEEREELLDYIEENTITLSHHYLSRQVIAGGGDNPLYEGGIALATFSLEHIYGIPYSINYAKKLFEFIESSEELKYGVLKGEEPEGTGYLRRTRNHWHEANSWGASSEELIGVLLGLSYFMRAIPSNSEYYQRAKELMINIAFYLKTHYWVYADSRLSIDFSNYADLLEDENKMVGNGLGPVLFEYPFSRVFKEFIGQPYTRSFEETMDKVDVLSSTDGFFRLLISIYPAIAEIAEYVASWTEYDDLVLSLGNRIVDTHGEIYELVVANAEPVYRHFEVPFWNLTMLLYTGIMVLDPDAINSGALAESRAKDFAQWFLRHAESMMRKYDGSSTGFNYYDGTASENLLFAVIAKRCFDLLSNDEVLEALNLGDRSLNIASRRVMRDKFKEEIEQVLESHGMQPSGGSYWQHELPLGEPQRFYGETLADYLAGDYPWVTSQVPPGGYGHNHAWRYPDKNFYFYSRNDVLKPNKDPIKKMFDRVGPYYRDDSGSWSLEETLKNLRRFARVGYELDDPEGEQLISTDGSYFKMEAGGNDLMFMRMLMVHWDMSPPPVIPIEPGQFPTLPIPGSTPWTDTDQKPKPSQTAD